MGTGGRGGLEDIVVSTSDICFIDGREGRLVYRGYDVNDLVEHSSFEEVIFLLWHGGAPEQERARGAHQGAQRHGEPEAAGGHRLAAEGPAEEDHADGGAEDGHLGPIGV